jgi:hypothetical protein
VQEEGQYMGEQGVLRVPGRADAVAAMRLHAQQDQAATGRTPEPRARTNAVLTILEARGQVPVG